jgi:tRNA-Thr(GGU) m(6)t(6)A37 methyltransferase TsaA
MEVSYHPIGIIHSPFKKHKGTPIQPKAGKNKEGTVELFKEYSEGLKDLNEFSHIILIYHLHLAGDPALHVKPYLENQYRGIFATRAPVRPNSIGLSVVRLEKVEGNMLHIKDLDIIDGTPLLDIKPYVPEFDRQEKIKIGWLERYIENFPDTRDEGRFSEE